MEISVSELVTGVADVRRTPLSRLAQDASGTEGLRRVLPGPVDGRVSSATFNSSI
jgi:hypothetical protein